jgi:hypothetical protein
METINAPARDFDDEIKEILISTLAEAFGETKEEIKEKEWFSVPKE